MLMLCILKQYRHAIPSEQRIREIWLRRINNPKLYTLENLSNYRVCDTHFANMCRDLSGKLIKYALPTMNLESEYTHHPFNM